MPFIKCPKCESVNIYRWFCGEYTCQDCFKLFGSCEEIKNFTLLQNCKEAQQNGRNES